MKTLLKRFVKDESGTEMAEWAVMAGLIILAAVGLIVTIGSSINSIFTKVDTSLTTADGAYAAP